MLCSHSLFCVCISVFSFDASQQAPLHIKKIFHPLPVYQVYSGIPKLPRRSILVKMDCDAYKDGDSLTFLNDHRAQEHFICYVCEIGAPSESALFEHWQRNHHATQCRNCEAWFMTGTHLAAHQRDGVSCMAHDELLIECDGCHVTLPDKSALVQHILSNFMCAVCSQHHATREELDKVILRYLISTYSILTLRSIADSELTTRSAGIAIFASTMSRS